MTASGLGNSPLDIALNSLGATPRKPDQAVSVKDSFDGLARETNVPANVLLALDEAEGGAGDLSKARRNAAFLSQHLAGGAKIEDAVSALAGDPCLLRVHERARFPFTAPPRHGDPQRAVVEHAEDVPAGAAAAHEMHLVGRWRGDGCRGWHGLLWRG